MSLVLVDEPDQLREVGERLESVDRLAIDLEAAGFHRYSDRVCLVQLSTRHDTWVLDPLALDVGAVLKGPLEAPDVGVLVHGADYDMRLLDRDFGINPRGVFDTQIAASFLGEPSIGLAALLEKYAGVTLSKKYQRADWAQRPLTPPMLEYAAADTLHLHALADMFAGRLSEAGRLHWVEEECRALEQLRWTADEEVDPVTRFKGARDLDDLSVHRLRIAWYWRDAIARRRDRAPFRIVGDPVLLDVAKAPPATVAGLVEVKGMPHRLAGESGAELLEQLAAAGRLSEDALSGFPKRAASGPGRPPPEVEERAERLKGVRNKLAEQLGLDRGVLMSNGVLLDIARDAPDSLELISKVESVRDWQVEVAGGELLSVMVP
jgi:ribonuclease D